MGGATPAWVTHPPGTWLPVSQAWLTNGLLSHLYLFAHRAKCTPAGGRPGDPRCLSPFILASAYLPRGKLTLS